MMMMMTTMTMMTMTLIIIEPNKISIWLENSYPYHKWIYVLSFSRATSRRDSKGYRSSRVGIDFIEADCLRDEDSSGHATRTKIGPESAMSECRGEGGGGRGGGGSHSCIYQKLNNIRIVESSRLPSHLSNQCGTFHKQGPDVELEEAVDDETAFRGPRCVINVPDDGLFRDITKI